jgi:hypothetical protein
VAFGSWLCSKLAHFCLLICGIFNNAAINSTAVLNDSVMVNNELQACLGDMVGPVPDHSNKAGRTNFSVSQCI